MKIIVFGAGAIGRTLAVMLSQHNDVHLVVRSSSIDATAPLILVGETQVVQGPKLDVVPSSALTVPLEDSIVFVCVKAHKLEDACRSLQAALTPSTTLVFVQNGLGILDRAARLLPQMPADNFKRMLCWFGAKYGGNPCKIAVTGWPLRVVIPAADEMCRHVGLLRAVGFRVGAQPSVEAAEWAKALFNVFVNPVASLVNRDNGVILEDLGLRSLALNLVREAVAVARAEGVSIECPSEEFLDGALASVATNINSNLADLRRGEVSDMQFLLGAIQSKARARNIAVPSIDVVYSLFGYLERHKVFAASAT